MLKTSMKIAMNTCVSSIIVSIRTLGQRSFSAWICLRMSPSISSTAPVLSKSSVDEDPSNSQTPSRSRVELLRKHFSHSEPSTIESVETFGKNSWWTRLWFDNNRSFSSTDRPFIHRRYDRRITRAIQRRLLPRILNLLRKISFSINTLTNSGTATKNATIDEQRQQAVLLTITCALIATKLIVVFSPDFLEQHIATILLHLIELLRSRLYLIRDQARNCLSKCMTILGERYFKFILKMFVNDFFNVETTESSKANEHENSSYKLSGIPEVKTDKTGHVMELFGWLIQSDDELLTCIEPLRQQLSSNNDSRQILKC